MMADGGQRHFGFSIYANFRLDKDVDETIGEIMKGINPNRCI